MFNFKTMHHTVEKHLQVQYAIEPKQSSFGILCHRNTPVIKSCEPINFWALVSSWSEHVNEDIQLYRNFMKNWIKNFVIKLYINNRCIQKSKGCLSPSVLARHTTYGKNSWMNFSQLYNGNGNKQHNQPETWICLVCCLFF